MKDSLGNTLPSKVVDSYTDLSMLFWIHLEFNLAAG